MKKLAVAILMIILASSAMAIVPNWQGGPYNFKVDSPLDQEIINKLPNEHFLLNIGPTGIRGTIKLTDWNVESDKEIEVKFVFSDSPANGKVRVGDVIVGANGELFTEGHMIGRQSNDPQGKFAGWKGMMTEMGQAILDSQAAEGKLDLMIRPRGSSSVKTVTVEIEAVGAFSPTYPENCPRSDAMLTKLCDFLVSGNDKIRMAHGNAHTVLALMASGDSKYEKFILGRMEGLFKQRPTPQDGGFACWGWGLNGVVLGEYYLLTGDPAAATAMEARQEAQKFGLDPGAMSYSHRPYPVIQQRAAAGGPKGYGAMAPVGAIMMLAMSLAKEGEVAYAEDVYAGFHNAFNWSVGKDGSAGIAYGWSATENHAVIELGNAAFSPCKSDRGIGYECMTGMKDIGPYTIAWPTKADPRWKPTDWIADEADKNRVFQYGGGSRIVYRYRKPDPETTAPFSTSGATRHHAPCAYGALAHVIGNRDSASWIWLGQHLANGIANNPETWWDGMCRSF